MSRDRRGLGWQMRAAWVAVLLCVVVVVVGCGGSGGPGVSGGLAAEAAVRVGSQVISVATVEHWIPIEAVLSTEGHTTKPVAAGVIPDPPGYSACAAHLQAVAGQKIAVEPKPTLARYKHECQAEYANVRTHILTILIDDMWIQGEAVAHGIHVSDSEVKKRFNEIKQREFPSAQQFHNFLSYTGLTEADDLQLYKKNLLSTKLLAQVLRRPGTTPQQQQRNFAEYVTRWVIKTSCKPQYMVPDCKGYKGPGTPGE